MDIDSFMARQQRQNPHLQQYKRESQVEVYAQRDRRTVFCRQLAMKLEPKELEDLLTKAGRVRDVSLVFDRVTKRFRGLAYVEFYEEDAVKRAIDLSGTVLRGVPIIIEMTETEKNRLAKEVVSASLKPSIHSGDAGIPPRNIVDSQKSVVNSETTVVLYDISKDTTEADVRQFTRSIGSVCGVDIDYSRRRAKVYFRRASDVQAAVDRLNGTKFLGRQVRVEVLPDKTNSDQQHSRMSKSEALNLDADEMDEEERVLRAKRAKLQAEMAVPRAVCLLNMYNPQKETSPNWKDEISEEVRLEAQKMGLIEHLHVPGTSDGAVYIRFDSVEAANSVVSTFSGRWFGGMQIVANILSVGEYSLKYPSV